MRPRSWVVSAVAGLTTSLLPACAQMRNCTQPASAPLSASAAPDLAGAIPGPLTKVSTPFAEPRPAAPPEDSAGPAPVPARTVSRDLTPPAPLAVASIPVPAEMPAPAPAARTTPATELKLVEDPLVSALRCYLNKRPDEALTLLKRYDKSTQELLLLLLPLVARVAEGGTQANNPQEIKVVVDQMEDVTSNLRTRAPFSAEDMSCCSNVEKFGS